MSVPLSEAAQELSQRSGKKVLILFTDGDDNSSALNASTAVARAKRAGVPCIPLRREKRGPPRTWENSSMIWVSVPVAQHMSQEARTHWAGFSRNIRRSLALPFGPHCCKKDGSWYTGASPATKSVARIKQKVGDLSVPSQEGAWSDTALHVNG